MRGSIEIQPVIKQLREYTNGNYTVKIYEDGTKIRKNNKDYFDPEVPESLDVKITNKCDLLCAWCHECSTPYGKHCDPDTLLNKLSTLPRGVEIAIGGGNPFEHPDLSYILACLKHFGLICNITFNEQHFEQYSCLIQRFIDEKLIYGYGISCNRSFSQNLHEIIHEHCSSDRACVIPHLIAGINTNRDIERAITIYGKCLILGFKQYGRGSAIYSSDYSIREQITATKEHLAKLLQMGIVSFDNLAIGQLDVKNHLTDKQWSEMYMGDDGDYSIYYNAVKDYFKKNSIASQNIKATDAVKAFKNIGTIK